MITHIAFLRGINVGGHKKIPMAQLRATLTETGLDHVQTYIQSGNVVFQSSEENKAILELKIQNAIAASFGFEVPVVVLTHDTLKQVFDNCPFSEEHKKISYFMLLFDKPEKHLVEAVSKTTYPNEVFKITDTCIYFYSSVGYGRAKCNNAFFEKKLKITATARNYKTMVKLVNHDF